MSHGLNLCDVGGPRALDCGSFKLDPALFHAFLQMAFQSEQACVPGVTGISGECFLVATPTRVRLGEGQRECKTFINCSHHR